MGGGPHGVAHEARICPWQFPSFSDNRPIPGPFWGVCAPQKLNSRQCGCSMGWAPPREYRGVWCIVAGIQKPRSGSSSANRIVLKGSAGKKRWVLAGHFVRVPSLNRINVPIENVIKEMLQNRTCIEQFVRTSAKSNTCGDVRHHACLLQGGRAGVRRACVRKPGPTRSEFTRAFRSPKMMALPDFGVPNIWDIASKMLVV